MGCSSSSEAENDRNAVGGTNASSKGDNASYADQAADEAAAMIEGGGSLSSALQLSIAVKNLQNTDVGSLSDPFVVVSEKEETASGGGGRWKELARTEIVANNLSPTFVTLVPVTYRFEEVQKLRFDVYDVSGDFASSDASRLRLAEQTPQGSAECIVAQIVGGRNQSWEGSLHCPSLPSQRASIKVRAEKVTGADAAVRLKLRGERIGKSDRSRHFLRISRTSESGPPLPCFKTETQAGANPAWAEIRAQLRQLANGDAFRPLVFECFRYVSSGRGAHELVGRAEASVNDLVAAVTTSKAFALVSEESKAKYGASYTDSGIIRVEAAQVVVESGFLDYLAGGLNLDFIVGIDFTASNGDPSQPNSLHYRGAIRRNSNAVAPPPPPPYPGAASGASSSAPPPPNPYAAAITSVGSVLEFYDDDKRFAVFGFGGCPFPRSPPLHAFPVNGNEDDPCVTGVAGILDAYYTALEHVTLSGPTLFAPLITRAAQVAASRRSNDPENQRYTVLLIVTDGLIGDMAATSDAIVAAAGMPLSIIIVGVGAADFSAMEVLDGDDVRLTDSQGRAAERDIVQFVEYRKVAGRGSHAVAREVLAEIPGQVIEYMKSKRLRPGARRSSAASVRHE